MTTSSKNRQPELRSWEQAVAELIADPTQSSLVADCYFDGTAVEAGHRYWASTEWQSIRHWLPQQPRRVLDIGAGRGISSFALASDGWTVDALEPDSSQLVGANAIRKMAHEAGLSITVHESFGENLPFGDQTFDLVFARQALHHARDLGRLAEEMFRVLRPGGKLVAVRDHVISRPADLPDFFGIHPLHRFYGGENAHPLGYYVSRLKNAGFDVEKILAPLTSPINYAPYDEMSLAEALAAKIPGGSFARQATRRLLGGHRRRHAVFWLLSKIDRRPGRLYSFVARRPER